MKRDWIYLVQTDTTVGFLSCNPARLAAVKGRPAIRPFLKAYPDFAALNTELRIPPKDRRHVRKSVKTSFILPNGRSFRVVKGSHADFLRPFGGCYSTSANRHGERFDADFARRVCDVVVESKEGFRENPPSRIYKLSRKRRKKVR